MRNTKKRINTDIDMQIVSNTLSDVTLYEQEFVTNNSGNDEGYLWLAIGQWTVGINLRHW